MRFSLHMFSPEGHRFRRGRVIKSSFFSLLFFVRTHLRRARRRDTLTPKWALVGTAKLASKLWAAKLLFQVADQTENKPPRPPFHFHHSSLPDVVEWYIQHYTHAKSARILGCHHGPLYFTWSILSVTALGVLRFYSRHYHWCDSMMSSKPIAIGAVPSHPPRRCPYSPGTVQRLVPSQTSIAARPTRDLGAPQTHRPLAETGGRWE